MTPELREKIKLGLSYTKPISPQDITRLQEWIENNLDTVLGLALQQADEIDTIQAKYVADVKMLNDRLIERREAYEDHIAQGKPHFQEFVPPTPSPSQVAQPDAGAVHPQP